MAAATPSATLEAGCDYSRACPRARWLVGADRRAEYGISGLPSCATVEAEPGETRPYSTAYHMVCCVSGRTWRGRRHDVADAMQETRLWLATVGCPGLIEPG